MSAHQYDVDLHKMDRWQGNVICFINTSITLLRIRYTILIRFVAGSYTVRWSADWLMPKSFSITRGHDLQLNFHMKVVQGSEGDPLAGRYCDYRMLLAVNISFAISRHHYIRFVCCV